MEDAPIFQKTSETGDETDSEKSKDKDKKKSKRVGETAIVAPERKKIESEPVSKAEAPDDTIGKLEKPVIEKKLVPVIQALNAEKEPDPDTDPAAERFLELTEQDGSESAYEQVVAELDALDIAEAEEASEEEPVEETGEEIVFDRNMFETEPDDEDAANTTTSSSGGSRTPPPVPPAPPSGGGSVPPRPPLGPQLSPGGFHPNFAPPTPTIRPNVQPKAPDMIEDRANPAAMALFGGIIGYLIGRRRGRIKTEKKLLPVQKKLEKEVTNLQFELQEKEKKIRRVAAAKVREAGPAVLEIFQKPLIPKLEAVFADKLHGSQARERIGHVLISAEAAPARRKHEKEIVDKKIDIRPEAVAGKRIETLNRAELLSLSEKVLVEGSSLRQIYETHLIGERGLRRLVAEHLRGGDLKKALRREIVEREIDFERDPALRDMTPFSSGGSVDGGKVTGNAVLNKMVEKASSSLPAASEEAAFLKARAAYDAKQLEQQQKHRQIVDASLVGIIFILLALVAVLIITHRQSI